MKLMDKANCYEEPDKFTTAQNHFSEKWNIGFEFVWFPSTKIGQSVDYLPENCIYFFWVKACFSSQNTSQTGLYSPKAEQICSAFSFIKSLWIWV